MFDSVKKIKKKEYDKKYREANKDKLNQYIKEYRENNKDKLKEQQQKKYECECGGKYTHQNKSIHIKSKRHRLHIIKFI